MLELSKLKFPIQIAEIPEQIKIGDFVIDTCFIKDLAIEYDLGMLLKIAIPRKGDPIFIFERGIIGLVPKP